MLTSNRLRTQNRKCESDLNTPPRNVNRPPTTGRKRVGLRTPRRRLGVHDAGDEPADRIVEDRAIVDYWTGIGPASALPQQGNANRIVGSRGIRGLTVV